MDDPLPPVIDAVPLPLGGLTLDGYRRLVYGLACLGCHKSLHSRVVARIHAHGLPVAGRQQRYRLTMRCNRSPCGLRLSLDKLVLFILAAGEGEVRATSIEAAT